MLLCVPLVNIISEFHDLIQLLFKSKKYFYMKSHPNPFNNTSHNFCLITLILVCFYIESVYSQSLPSYIDAVIENACLNDGSITISLIDPPFQVVEYFWYEGNLQGQDFTPILSNFNYVQDLGQGYYTLSMLSSSGCRAHI